MICNIFTWLNVKPGGLKGLRFYLYCRIETEISQPLMVIYTLANKYKAFWLETKVLIIATHVTNTLYQFLKFWFSHGDTFSSVQFSSVRLLSRVRLFATPWIAARQASLSTLKTVNCLWIEAEHHKRWTLRLRNSEYVVQMNCPVKWTAHFLKIFKCLFFIKHMIFMSRWKAV